MKQFLAVGQIINTHGLKGELKVYPLTDDIKRFRKLDKVLIDGVERNIVWCKLQADTVILKIEGVDTLEDAHKLRNKYLEIDRKNAVELPENTFFVADLIGCSVFDSNNNFLGNIFDVIKTGSNDVYWIKEGKELLIPALKDIVELVDIENKKIVIKPVELWQ
ncbi:MAG: ribosome maturation factor RimM [Solirubrobacterales bacterium]